MLMLRLLVCLVGYLVTCMIGLTIRSLTVHSLTSQQPHFWPNNARLRQSYAIPLHLITGVQSIHIVWDQEPSPDPPLSVSTPK